MTTQTYRPRRGALPDTLGFDAQSILWVLLLIFTAAIAVYHLLSLFGLGLTLDEGLYMSLIKQMAIGRNIYLTFVDHQAPGIAFIGVPFVWIFGYTALAAKVHSFFFCLLFTCAAAYLGWAFSHSRRSAA